LLLSCVATLFALRRVWQVQADFLSSTTRSLRGIALSPMVAEYLGDIQGTSGTTAVREYSSDLRRRIPRRRRDGFAERVANRRGRR